MTARILLPEVLAELCSRKCSPCANEAACSCPVLESDGPVEDRTTAMQTRWVNLPLPRCGRCEFMLLMEAVKHLLPAEEHADWLSQRNPDLSGRAPTECIDAGDYDPVFRALFLLDPCGPVS
jgi:hypothetical protein